VSQQTQQESLNPFTIAQRQLDRAAEFLELAPAIHAFLRQPMRELHVTLPVKMDDGTVEIFDAYRVQYNNARGPTKGGLRFHPDETIDTIRALAAWMTWKTAVVNIPLGGGKGGVACNTKELSPSELERVSRAYIRQVGCILGLTQDVPAPDMYTNPQVMAWMADEFAYLKGYTEFGVITGKPLELGGSEGRMDATARGGMYTIDEAAKVLGMDLEGATVAIQGFGNAGQYAAALIQSMFGSKVVAVSDSKGGIYNPHGLDPEAVIQHKNMDGRVAGYPDADALTNAELLELDVDILIPAALEAQITRANADNVKAKLIPELANGPTTPDADAVLFDKGAYVIPDFLCNAGGVTVSYFEMVQNAYQYYWDEPTVHQRLKGKMVTAFHDVYEAAQRFSLDNRMAAYLVAVDRVAKAVRLRGWV
jgi:glutamate dehydrogenase (NAD(P)+)